MIIKADFVTTLQAEKKSSEKVKTSSNSSTPEHFSGRLIFLHLKVIKYITLVLCQFERGPFSNFGEQLVNASILPHYTMIPMFSPSLIQRGT